MNATEARRKSKINGPIVRQQEQDWIRKEQENKRKKEEEKHNQFYDKLKKDVDQHIEWAVKRGDYSIEYRIDRAYPNRELKDFLSTYEFTPELNKLVNYLTNKRFKAKIEKVVTAHDEREAYMNSGGECGNSQITYSNDLVIRISW